MNAVLILLLVAAAVASAAEPRRFYHSSIGIKEAARIKKAEDALRHIGARVVGGVAAPVGAHPYFGGLLITLLGGYTSVCGSSLISYNRALTAAQCWYDGQIAGHEVTVVLGSNYLFHGGLRVLSRDVIMHEQWDPLRNVNDIAIINMPYVPMSNYIQPIRLPSNNYDTFVGVNAQLSGFGYTDDERPITANQYLSHVNLPVISNEVCASYFPAYIFSSNICTSGDGGKGPCISDVGGPLTTYSYGQRVLIGVAQFTSVFGCQAGFPAAYSRVSYYLPWIQRYL
ncbi:hypothetical protein O3G_MSEX004110 [Manduca sexta]|uniref:Peptidase S1 domain-containing protein n=1 Tax=Manduca sexta TaxID=7130 RepID=A0A921YVE9_MANSE|nr:hypothetical protein O3G_MSEX004110 [Manduca sexta]KAG6445781.1 hypothetical protein O3G_MSEX004110 [Manduca sexta]